MSNSNSIKPGRKLVNLEGMSFGLLTVLSRAQKSGRGTHWVCVCECGHTSVAESGNLKAGRSRSCGCLQRAAGKSNRTHGMTDSPEYRAWTAMWDRCINLSNPAFPEYSQRTPPDEWREFKAFFKELGLRPSSSHSVDRVDNDKPYGPGNCRWATAEEQARNRSSNVDVLFNGTVMCLTEACQRSGLSVSAVRSSRRRGAGIPECSGGAFTDPPQGRARINLDTNPR